MQGINTPTMKSPLTLVAAAGTWMEMLNNADVVSTTLASSSPPLPNLASTTVLWMEMEGTNTSNPGPNSTHHSPLADIAQIWVDMDSASNGTCQAQNTIQACYPCAKFKKACKGAKRPLYNSGAESSAPEELVTVQTGPTDGEQVSLKKQLAKRSNERKGKSNLPTS